MATRNTPYKTVHAVEVRAWGKRVGAVALEPTKNFYAFQYDPAWIRGGVELAPLSMPLAQSSEPFMFTDLPEATFKRLPAMLADALPDDFGNALIGAWMADHGVRREAVTPLDRLAYMGKRGMGVLTFGPMRGPTPTKPSAIEMGKLVEAARMAVHGEFDSEDHAQAALKQIIQVGTSAGGARAKATIAWNPQTEEVRTGQFDIPEGFEAWLLKFDGMGPDNQLGPSGSYGRIEYAYHQMVLAAAIEMSPCRLLRENGRAHFMTQRFDRTGNLRHHIQTLCAISHLNYKQVGTHSYNQLFNAAQSLKVDQAAMVQVLRRMVFNVLASNRDDHTRQHSYLMDEAGGWRLAPAYDLTYSAGPGGEHYLDVEGEGKNPTREQVRSLGRRHGLPDRLIDTIIDEVRAAVADWARYAEEAGVTKASRAEIAAAHQDVAVRFSA